MRAPQTADDAVGDMECYLPLRVLIFLHSVRTNDLLSRSLEIFDDVRPHEAAASEDQPMEVRSHLF